MEKDGRSTNKMRGHTEIRRKRRTIKTEAHSLRPKEIRK